MKTKEELENIKERLEKLSAELHELTDDELAWVVGGKENAVPENLKTNVFNADFEDFAK